MGPNGSRDSEIRTVSAKATAELETGFGWTVVESMTIGARDVRQVFPECMETNVRAVEELDVDHLAKLWFEGWQEAHAQIVPGELRQLRTLDSFRQRL